MNLSRRADRPELLEIFRGYYARRQSEFVTESEKESERTRAYDRYRCGRNIGRLLEWSRSKGVRLQNATPKPAQGANVELRKL